MYNMAKGTYTCDICGREQKCNAPDDHQGNIWECEKCHDHFCAACFVQALGQAEWDWMVGESDKIFCPFCYGQEQVKDYMVHEEETNRHYPFQKRYEQLSAHEISQVVDACKGHFDTEVIREAIISVIGTARPVLDN